MIHRYFSLLLFILLGVLSLPVNAQRMLNLAEGDAQTLRTEGEIQSIFISDPNVADYQVIDRHTVVVFGKQVGNANLIVFGENSQTLTSRRLVVNKSMVHIQQQIQMKYPHAEVTVYNLGEQVVLSGMVASEKERDEINLLVGELLGKNSIDSDVEWKLGDNSYKMEFMQRRRFEGVVNNIEVASTKQVNVKLSIAEVSQSFMEKFGIQLGSSGQNSGIFVNPLRQFSSTDIMTLISAIGDDTVGQVLAEPNLSVISGETASFLVGGELPVVTIVDGGTNVLYKEFGVRLEMMAKVQRDDKIRLSLMPEVSSLDTQYANDTYNLPALKTRRARTTVELGDGQSFVLGGLLNKEESELLRKIPFIGDIPILGALFRHTETSRNKTELVIIATVNLVQPIQPSGIQLPSMQRTSTLERFFALDPEKSPVEQQLSQQILATGGFKQ
ncbi:general secretion pathway protein GspD [Vibrio sp. V27_P1S3P104]|uniref:type II and III secretion system protein family protein n=1 Tax=unclassified Vibrio TaxID=2614977 RepID=UPI001373635B|nr:MULTISPECIES: pilus assembly protein N-terminal domain-containing protein [unclassified Vibrio]NAW70024.1 general secretion pathway protein GspD [Vibrio sp. V28_P6S34P95]NAX04095.1 general secretion pathway protein GspD [Vibrio sp. V30_P3S12P165]NAX34800.1 general secretion pathway protein GspD [Vibrio sp. V29_P1S30P107]NAX38913.1 general secretion pathway protein GspD [Vibrio sp. V27_P1S3P104]NAX40857.1 general secretion pathway protein GspD [Vibrio sp. V26_P1S5P106]